MRRFPPHGWSRSRSAGLTRGTSFRRAAALTLCLAFPPATALAAPTAPTGPAPGQATTLAGTGVLASTTGSLLPIAVARARWHDVMPVADGQPHYGRAHHDYPAVDIFAQCGSTVVAPISGVIVHVTRTDRWNPRTNLGADRGGLSVALVGVDGVRYYGSHLRSVVPGLRIGSRVGTGTVLGQVGNSGDARGIACHLHFGISPACAQWDDEDWWTRRGVLAPAPFLDAWRRGRAASPARAIAQWQLRHGCPRRPTVDA